MAARSLRPQLNQIRAWVRQGRTDAWIAHQLEVSVKDLRQFKRDHELEAPDSGDSDTVAHDDELDLRAADDELVAAALESESDEDDDEEDEDEDRDEGDEGQRLEREGRAEATAQLVDDQLELALQALARPAGLELAQAALGVLPLEEGRPHRIWHMTKLARQVLDDERALVGLDHPELAGPHLERLRPAQRRDARIE